MPVSASHLGQPKNPLHGVTLEAMLSALVAHFGWSELGARIQINSFNTDPSIASSLKFLRRTPWAREKVEGLYLYMRREQARQTRTDMTASSPAPTAPTEAPFGSWASPITAALIASATIRLGQVALRGREVFWSEGRPQEQGRNVVVQYRADGSVVDVNPAPLNVRTRAHEYGGGAFVVLADGIVFSHDDDQQLYRIGPSGAAQQLTHEPGQRYADAVLDAGRNRLIAVREDHRAGSRGSDAPLPEGSSIPTGAAGPGFAEPAGRPADAVATLVAIALDTGAVQVLAHGHDFFSSPCLSPDGRRLAWLAWDHPNMPWDGTGLWVADVAPDGLLAPPRRVAGGPMESIFQPAWSPRGELHFASDLSGWWNLYREHSGEAQPLHPMAAEFGVPQWAFGMSTYGFDAQGRIVCVYQQEGESRLAMLDTDSGRFETLATPFCAIEGLRVGDDFAVFIGGTSCESNAIVRLDLRTLAHTELRSASSTQPPAGYVSAAEAITFATEGNRNAHAFFYAPANRGHRGSAGERAPLIVVSHGGPTGATDAAFKWGHQFWTSRGFAVVDVNYGGSAGFGREYRERLNGQWGVVDVDDAINAARHLIERGDVDAERVIIRGASAGGYTTLSALAFRRFFKAGASHYGIGDLEALALDTHKFESRYLDRLIGPYPDAKASYRARSPIHFTDALSSPMILFQGDEDKAVPPAQARSMFDAVNAKGLPVALLLFEGEQHGFRRAATIRRALEAELYFYGKIFGFAPADAIEPVDIRNLPPA